MKVTALVENTSCMGSIGFEHGLSLYIEVGDHKILFDMGQTELFAENAVKLGVDLSAVDFAVLSHGHYDHGGGLKKFFEINGNAPVYVSRYAFGEHYNGTEKYIGLDGSLNGEKRFFFTDGEMQILPGITLFSGKGKEKLFDLGNFGLNVKCGGEFLPDGFLHEQYLLIEEKGKKVLFSGCSHKGVLNIVSWFSPHVLIGGFHFSKIEDTEKLLEYARFLDSFDTDYYTCHCTGQKQYEFMKKHVKSLRYLSSGTVAEI